MVRVEKVQQAGEGSGKRGLHQLRQVFLIAKVGFEKCIVGGVFGFHPGSIIQGGLKSKLGVA
jgi:hypothetical protein